jgi:TetR/AcrR family transcriptional regulator, acrAB operon repressor
MRRSRQDALRTKQGIVLAARKVFARHGVSRTTMAHIAKAAGVTRGAIYGHFRDKGALFRAMREQVRLPLVDAMSEVLFDSPGDPLAGVERYLLAVVGAMRDDEATRDTFHILNFKCEYVEDFEGDLKHQAERASDFTAKLARAFRAAARHGQLRPSIAPRLAALQTCAFLIGLMRLWLLDSGGAMVRRDVARLVRAHIASLRSGR